MNAQLQTPAELEATIVTVRVERARHRAEALRLRLLRTAMAPLYGARADQLAQLEDDLRSRVIAARARSLPVSTPHSARWPNCVGAAFV